MYNCFYLEKAEDRCGAMRHDWSKVCVEARTLGQQRRRAFLALLLLPYIT
jgi:hypothetical protein